MNTVLVERIKIRMDALGLNACRAATMATLGRTYVLDILRGKVSDPGARSLQKLAAVLECSPDYLLGDPVAEASRRYPSRPADACNDGHDLLKAPIEAAIPLQAILLADTPMSPAMRAGVENGVKHIRAAIASVFGKSPDTAA